MRYSGKYWLRLVVQVERENVLRLYNRSYPATSQQKAFIVDIALHLQLLVEARDTWSSVYFSVSVKFIFFVLERTLVHRIRRLRAAAPLGV